MAGMVPIGPQYVTPERSSFAPRDLVYVAFRRKYWILAIWLPILAVGSIGLFKRTGAFVSSSKLLLELQSPQNPSLVLTTRLVDYDLAISTYTNIAMSVPVAQIAARTLADSLAVLTAIDPERARLADRDKMLEFILDHLDATRVGESNLIDIRYQSPDERTALLVNRAVRDAFLGYAVSAGRNSRAISFYAEQVQKAEAEIDSLLALREQISRETGISLVQQDTRPRNDLVADLTADFYGVNADASQLEANIALLTTALAQDPDFVPSGPGAQHLTTMRDRLANEREVYYQLLAAHPETSQKVQRQAGILEALRAEMRTAVQDHLRSQQLEVQGLRAKAAVLERQIAEVAGSLETMPSAYRRITMLDAQIASRSELLEGLQLKSGEVRVAEMADDRVSRLTVITEPEIDTVISESRKFALFGALAAFGLGLGLLLGVVVDRNDHRIHDTRVLSQAVEVPVLGSISAGKR